MLIFFIFNLPINLLEAIDLITFWSVKRDLCWMRMSVFNTVFKRVGSSSSHSLGQSILATLATKTALCVAIWFTGSSNDEISPLLIKVFSSSVMALKVISRSNKYHKKINYLLTLGRFFSSIYQYHFSCIKQPSILCSSLSYVY